MTVGDTPLDAADLTACTALLPPALAEFVVVADTHLMDDSAPHAREFASRARQNERVEAALRAAAGLGSGMIVHVGDLVQDYPDSPLHQPLLVEAVRQWREVASDLHVAAGNTDVGDQHDPSTPAVPASHDSLRRFADAAGGCWSSFDVGPLHGIVVTASLFNSGLGLEDEQWTWLEAELAVHRSRRLALFFHYPLFLQRRSDPDVGNYDVVNEPARGRMLDLVERFGVELVVTGHSHFAFYNTHVRARLVGAPSTSFTRPGFSELFSSCPPPDRGRDDVPKLGFLLVRVHEDGVRVHTVRTGVVAERGGRQAAPVVSAVSADLPTSPLGVVLRHPVAQFAEVPDTFPSVVRQPVRNDYPVLACLELGARYVSVGVADSIDPALAQRLGVMRADGVSVVARVLWPDGDTPRLPPSAAPVDDVELVLLNRAVPTAHDLDVLNGLGWTGGLTLSTMMREPTSGAELPRWRYGLAADEAVAVDEALAEGGAPACRVLMAATGADEVSAVNQLAQRRQWRAVDGVDVTVPVDGYGHDAATSVTSAFLEASRGGGRIFIDSLLELDRTLNLNAGLLDRACNPRPAFHALRILNTLIHRDGAAVEAEGAHYTVHRPGMRVIVDPKANHAGAATPDPAVGGDTPADLVDLGGGVLVDAAAALGNGPHAWIFTVAD